MKHNLPPLVVGRRGMTLLELTLCISVILVVITIIFIGSRAWKRGSDRSGCVLTLRNVQVAARSYQNLYGYHDGSRPHAEYGSQDIARHLFEKGYIEKNLFDRSQGEESCPGGGAYSCPAPDIFPQAGQLYMTCSLSATDGHEPASRSDW